MFVPGIGAILLAAGESSRMGQRKQLLNFQGRTLLRRAAETAVEAGCNPVIVVLGCEAKRMQPQLAKLPVISSINANWKQGIGSSIKHGAAHLLEISPTLDAMLILLSDQPFVNADALRQLLDAFTRSGKPACVSDYAGTIGPPVIVGRPFFPRLSGLADSQGAKAIWSECLGEVAVHPCDEAAFDLDTPADYARAMSQTRAERNPG